MEVLSISSLLVALIARGCGSGDGPGPDDDDVIDASVDSGTIDASSDSTTMDAGFDMDAATEDAEPPVDGGPPGTVVASSVCNSEEPGHQPIAVSPDGTRVAYTTCTFDGLTIEVLDLDTMATTMLAEFETGSGLIAVYPSVFFTPDGGHLIYGGGRSDDGVTYRPYGTGIDTVWYIQAIDGETEPSLVRTDLSLKYFAFVYFEPDDVYRLVMVETRAFNDKISYSDSNDDPPYSDWLEVPGTCTPGDPGCACDGIDCTEPETPFEIVAPLAVFSGRGVRVFGVQSTTGANDFKLFASGNLPPELANAMGVIGLPKGHLWKHQNFGMTEYSGFVFNKLEGASQMIFEYDFQAGSVGECCVGAFSPDPCPNGVTIEDILVRTVDVDTTTYGAAKPVLTRDVWFIRDGDLERARVVYRDFDSSDPDYDFTCDATYVTFPYPGSGSSPVMSNVEGFLYTDNESRLVARNSAGDVYSVDVALDDPSPIRIVGMSGGDTVSDADFRSGASHPGSTHVAFRTSTGGVRRASVTATDGSMSLEASDVLAGSIQFNGTGSHLVWELDSADTLRAAPTDSASIEVVGWDVRSWLVLPSRSDIVFVDASAELRLVEL